MPRRILSDSQWARVVLLLPGKDGDPGRSARDNREFLEAVLWIARTGAPWRDLPDEFGLWNSVFQRFRRWARKGVFERVFEELSVDADFEYVLIDGTIVRLHQHGAGAKGGTRSQAIGRSRGGPSTKISVMVDALGNLVEFVLLPGQRHDLIGVAPLLDGVEFEALIADKAYDSNELRAQLQARGATVVIPPRSNRVDEIEYDSEMYKWRHLVENFFCKLKHFRRLAMRFEKTDVSYAAMIHVVSSHLALA